MKSLHLSVFLSFLLFLLSPFFLPTTLLSAIAVTSNCVITKIGNAPPNPPLPPECTGGGGNQKVIELAKAQLGDTYVWGAPNRNWGAAGDNPNGFDCSGLVGWSWFKATGGKVNFPSSTIGTWGKVDPTKFQTFTPAQKDQIQPGDAIYWAQGNTHHTALYEGPGGCPSKKCIIEAADFGIPVKESDYESRINKKGDLWLGFIRPINF